MTFARFSKQSNAKSAFVTVSKLLVERATVSVRTSREDAVPVFRSVRSRPLTRHS